VHCRTWLWPLLLSRSTNFGRDWLASQTRYARGSCPRRALHASSASPCHASATPPPLEGLSPSHGAFQGHAAHPAEWSATLRPTGSSSTCIPEGVSTFFHAAFTAHSEARAEAGGVGSTALFGTDSTRERGSSNFPLLFRASGPLSYVPKAAIIAS